MTAATEVTAEPGAEQVGSYGTDTRWSMAIFVGRSLSSLVFVLATSRALGSDRYGALAALSAATSIAAVLTTSGIAHAATMHAARSADGARNILRSGLRSGGPAALGVTTGFLIIFALFEEVTLLSAFGLFVADVLVAGLCEIVASTHIGLRQFRRAALIWIAFAIGRGLAAFAILAFGVTSLEAATTLAMIGSVIAIPVTIVQSRHVGRNGARVGRMELIRSGAVFTAGNLVARLNNDFDKLLLSSRLGNVSSVGTYAVGYRLVEYALLPLTALSAAAYPRMFRAGADGEASARGLARRLTAVYLGTALILTAVLFAGRHLAEWVFGSSYGDLSVVITMLLGIPVLRAAVNLLGEPLTGSGLHRRRVMVMVAAMCANIGTNLALLDQLGWRAAVWATYASEATQLMLLGGLALYVRRSGRRDSAASNTSA